MKRQFLLAPAMFCLLAAPAFADKLSYAMMLGSRQMGTLVYDERGHDAVLLSTMDNTPLGVADGTFEAITHADGNRLEYLGRSRGGKIRDIAVSWQGPKVTAVSVTPVEDMTTVSQAPGVPAGVISPTEVFAVLAHGGACPQPMQMYDGRRVVQMGTTETVQGSGVVTCEMSYRVVMGPGHLSPFRFNSFGMQIAYADGMLERITMSAGGFDFNLIREK